jgi:hypothetical protein
MLKVPATALAKAKVLAIVGTSLAAGGVGGAVALNHVAPTTQVVATVADSSDASAEPTVEPTDEPTVEPSDDASAEPSETPKPQKTKAPAAKAPTSASSYSLPPCPSDVKNHGAYVSSVAKGAPKGAHGEHGHWVSQAAASDCGKPSPRAGDATDKPEAGDSEAPDAPEASEAPESDGGSGRTQPTTTSHGKGHGKSSAH